ncbi:PLP-dependent aminotransferase family protein [Luteolibacter pohnpeiensis]|uniref:PLP-dependent aminotransferase family protein n=1 Tax=Luteolibacter pohnpeiensis TaxID=454153 RepID=A0A934VQN1_9BACT|nr:PLP-dependent aminotransferase family protein [Luteolibacter pohnpeiensis]MBK1882276.1 PLP-dependent aminotransferase family protein [Luteolibacter pohnpeiensis]
MTAPLYQDLAQRLSTLIGSGTFPAGSRMPSVRRMSRDQRVSVTTVLEAYGRLEDQGLIESRPRSGYYVRPPRISSGELPRAARHVAKPVEVEYRQIFEAVMDATSNPDVVPFGASIPGDDIIPSARLASITNGILRRHGAAAFRYTMSPGRNELRASVSRRLLSAGVKIGAGKILTTQGATEAIALSLMATTKPGDLVAVESPTYFGILQMLNDMGLQALEVPVDARNGFDLETFKNLLERFPVTACIVQPSYQNPVGSCMSDQAKAELVQLAIQHDFVLIEDDLHGEICHHGVRPLPLAHFDQDHRVIHCGAVSKILAPGLRVGWVANEKYYQRLRRLKSVYYMASGTISELVVAEFFDVGGYDRHLRRIRTLYVQRCTQIRDAVLEAFPEGTRVNLPSGGFVLWVEMPRQFDSEAFAVRAFAAGISLVPGTVFTPTGRMRNCFRLSCGSAFDERSAKAIKTLAKLAKQCLDEAG